MRVRPIIILAVASVVLLAGGILGYIITGGRGTDQGSEGVMVQRGTIEVTVSAYGNLVMGQRAELTFAIGASTFAIAGTVAEVNVKVGDSVEEGEVLARLDTTSLEAMVLQAWANLFAAEQALETADTPAARAAVEAARAALADAQEQFRKATIAAPFDGQVTYVGADVGDQVQANTIIVVLVDPNTVQMSTIIDELDITMIRKGQQARITIDALPDMEFNGWVTEKTLAPTTQEWTVGYQVSIRVEPVADVQLIEGLSASADIIVGRAENVLLVPNRAIKISDGQKVVEVLTMGGTEERIVQTGLSDGQWTEITEGLVEGERVIVR